MSTITQTITALPSAPSRSNPATFASLADAFVAALEDLPGEQNTQASQMNTVAGEVNANATSCHDSEVAAIASANFQGAWDSGTTYEIHVAVKYDNKIWASLQGSNLNHTPAEDTWWTQIGLVNKFTVSASAPSSPATDDVWFDIS